MAITIVVEDGSGVTNANSYVSVADARIYASNRGVELPLDDDELAAMLIRSTDCNKREQLRKRRRRAHLRFESRRRTSVGRRRIGGHADSFDGLPRSAGLPVPRQANFDDAGFAMAANWRFPKRRRSTVERYSEVAYCRASSACNGD
ncbi:hypothetical protein PSV3_00292 [Septimatrevirus PSV34]|uniref:Putative DnaT-like domain-containing protein n=1 Tax=Pseudomonas phage PSV3 TaxID=3003632 RepID=A0AAE9VZM2_9CAUD|nr:head-tail adaptor Ad1 [Pseudomonas phage PSV3]WBF76993.1 hypothetical protein PSV3_00292 [Pseudomonas phage PSV3]